MRDTIHAEVCAKGYDAARNTFVQSYGGKDLDASLLMMALVGFLPPSDPRVRGTVEAIERELVRDGLVARYPTTPGVDGLPPGEGTFLACSFWLADNRALLGWRDDAHHCFERLLGLRTDVGVLAEEYDPESKRLVGNFPQAFSHVALINTAWNLSRSPGPADIRPKSRPAPGRLATACGAATARGAARGFARRSRWRGARSRGDRRCAEWSGPRAGSSRAP